MTAAIGLRGGIILIFCEVYGIGDKYIYIIDSNTRTKDNKPTIRKSPIRAVCDQQYQVVLLTDQEEEEMVIHHYVKNEDYNGGFDENFPWYLEKVIAGYFSIENILIIYQENLNRNGVIFSTISVKQILETSTPKLQIKRKIVVENDFIDLNLS